MIPIDDAWMTKIFEDMWELEWDKDNDGNITVEEFNKN